MGKPRLLDLFCGAGGAAVGYSRAGFDVVGVDITPQPRYPFEFWEADALGALTSGSWREFDAIHASPPCQAYIRGGNAAKDGRHPRLIEPVRALLTRTGVPWVIENVPGAPMRSDLMLCGSMFGLELRRHRWFESNAGLLPWTLACNHSEPIVGVYGHPHGDAGAWDGMLPGNLTTWSRAMGIDWMTTKELKDAIPPAYTEAVGVQLLAILERGRAAA